MASTGLRSMAPSAETVAIYWKPGRIMAVDRPVVERRDESLHIAGRRVSPAAILREFQDGQSPEAIRSAFPTLTLEQVYGAITFYLGHKREVDSEIAARERIEDAFTETHRRVQTQDTR